MKIFLEKEKKYTCLILHILATSLQILQEKTQWDKNHKRKKRVRCGLTPRDENINLKI